jgi:hypothetical protein
MEHVGPVTQYAKCDRGEGETIHPAAYGDGCGTYLGKYPLEMAMRIF